MKTLKDIPDAVPGCGKDFVFAVVMGVVLCVGLARVISGAATERGSREARLALSRDAIDG